jgi:hypothetical protein
MDKNHAEFRVVTYEIPKLEKAGYIITKITSLELRAVKNENVFNICYPNEFPFKPCVIIRDNTDFIYRDWLPDTQIVYLLENFDDLMEY